MGGNQSGQGGLGEFGVCLYITFFPAPPLLQDQLASSVSG